MHKALASFDTALEGAPVMLRLMRLAFAKVFGGVRSNASTTKSLGSPTQVIDSMANTFP
jgi:hypothetical protein